MLFFPVINGSAVLKNKNRVISWVNTKGKIEIVSFKDKKNFFKTNFIFLRGILYLIFGIYIFIISLVKSEILNKTNNDFEDKLAKKLRTSSQVVFLTISGILGTLIGFLGLVLIPYFFFGMLVSKGVNLYLVAFIMAVIRVVLFLVILLCLKLIPSMRQFYRNNSAGNLAYADYKNKKLDSFYLSTNFLNYVVCGFIISFFVVSFNVAEINFFIKFLINFVITIIVFSSVYEFLKLFEFKNNLFSKFVIYPVAFLTCEKPTQTERETAFSAMNEVILMEKNEQRIIRENGAEIAFSVVFSEVKQRLNEAGITDSSESEWLIAAALNINRGELKTITHLKTEQYKKIKNALLKRENHMPLSKIFNSSNFYGRNFYIDKNVLSPRQETELVVEEAIKIIKESKKNMKVLDLMTGSGIIAITIALETNSTVIASDYSVSALEIAKKNAKNHNVKIKFVESDMLKSFKHEKFDIVISNPPYIPTKDIALLDDEVKKFDPFIALDGGEDGLYFYKEIANNLPQFLKENSVLILEIGYDQAAKVKKLLQNNFKNIKIKKDYGGNDRIIIATKK